MLPQKPLHPPISSNPHLQPCDVSLNFQPFKPSGSGQRHVGLANLERLR